MRDDATASDRNSDIAMSAASSSSNEESNASISARALLHAAIVLPDSATGASVIMGGMIEW